MNYGQHAWSLSVSGSFTLRQVKASMVLIEAVKDGKKGLRMLPELTIWWKNSDYTPEMRTKLFIAKMTESLLFTY